MYPKGGYNVGSSTNAQNLLFSGVKSFWFVWKLWQNPRQRTWICKNAWNKFHTYSPKWLVFHGDLPQSNPDKNHQTDTHPKNCRHPKSSSHTVLTFRGFTPILTFGVTGCLGLHPKWPNCRFFPRDRMPLIQHSHKSSCRSAARCGLNVGMLSAIHEGSKMATFMGKLYSNILGGGCFWKSRVVEIL